jgi:hypothetical protein
VFARTSTRSGSPDAPEKWVDHVQTRVSTFVAGFPGNAGGAFFVDRDAGTALTLTLWESEEAAEQTDRLRIRAAPAPSRRLESSWSSTGLRCRDAVPGTQTGRKDVSILGNTLTTRPRPQQRRN